MSNYLVLDIATMALPNAAEFLDFTDLKAPANYGPDAAAKYLEKQRAERLDRAALDWDLGRIACIGMRFSLSDDAGTAFWRCQDEERERISLEQLKSSIEGWEDEGRLVTFNGYKFDLPFLNVRAEYLGVNLRFRIDPTWKCRHVDLFHMRTAGGKLPGKSLEFYSRRYGWTDLVKPLTGAEEARAAQEGRYDEVAAAVAVDLQRTARLARVMGLGIGGQDQ